MYHLSHFRKINLMIDALDIVKSEWNYYIKYGHTSGIGMGGFELKLTKREFDQKLREIKLNNLLK